MYRGIFAFQPLTLQKIRTVQKLNFSSIFTSCKNLNPALIARVRKIGLKIYAEINIFSGEEWWEEYPDCRPIDKNGQPMKKINWYVAVCPNHPQVQQRLLDRIKLTINKLDIDGIWLDFMRYPCHWEQVRSPMIDEYCFCSNCLSKFSGEVGGKPEGERWTTWKCQNITNFVQQVRMTIDNSRKKILLGIFAVPWRKNDYKDAITRIIGQDFTSLSKFVDIFSPMTYHKYTQNNTSWIHDVIDSIRKVAKKPILPIVQTENKAGKIDTNEFKDELIQAMKAPSSGVVIFFLEDLVKDQNKLSMLSASIQ